MILGCSTLACTMDKYPKLDDVFSTLSRLGFNAVDIALFHGWQHVDPLAVAAHPRAWASRIGDGLRRFGLTPISINSGMSVSLSDPEKADQYDREFKSILALARSIGCPNVTINPGSPAAGAKVSFPW